MQNLQHVLHSIDGRGYKAYGQTVGSYQFAAFRLIIDHAQGDPFADPTRIRIQVAAAVAGFPPALRQSAIRRLALEDFLGRAVARAIQHHVKGARGTGKSGQVTITTNRQYLLKRNAVCLQEDGGVEARMQVGLPAAGRRVLAREAMTMLLEELPRVVAASLQHTPDQAAAMMEHIHSVEDQHHLRRWLEENRLVAFVADGARLPRKGGVDDRPMVAGVIPFVAPESLAREVTLPHAGKIRGLAIPQGVTLIVGGGFHGKTTLLQALQRGIHNHIPGDGRERVVTLADAVKIRAEDGRAVTGTDISPFINNLPGGRDTVLFTTDNASGSTSQAANIIEALACGCQLLLIDEDTSATNLMIRDQRMQALVKNDREPITPLLHRIRELFNQNGVSTILVMGGSGDYFSVADTVIMMDAYTPREVTSQAHHLAAPLSETMPPGQRPPFSRTGTPPPKIPTPAQGRKPIKIVARETNRLQYGQHTIDLTQVEQLLDPGQTRAIGYLMHHYTNHFQHKSATLEEGLRLTLRHVKQEGLDILTPWITGTLALPRLHELTAAIHRLRKETP